MSDFNSSLPVRTQNNGDVVINIADGTTNTNLLTVDTSGRLTIKLDDGSGNLITSQASGLQRALDVGINVAGVQVDPRLIGVFNTTLPTLTSGSQASPSLDSSGRLLVASYDGLLATQTITAQDVATTSSSVADGQTWYTGSPTAGSAASFTLASAETGMIEITGTWTGTLQVEISVDGGTNWIAHSVHVIGTPLFISSFTANVLGSINLAAKTNIRVRATSTWTGTATIRLNVSANPSSVYVANSLKIVDGSSQTSTTTLTIKAASTAAIATDTAAVVALSPNSPLPAGTNTIGKVAQDNTIQWVTSDLADGSVTGGTAGTKSLLAGLVYQTSAPTLTAGQQAAMQGDSSGNLKVNVNVPLPAGTNAIGSVLANLQVSNAAVTITNPVPVTVTSASPGTPVQYYQTTAAVAKNASTTFTYTVATGHTFSLQRVWATASGKIKAVVQNNGATIFVGFNSTSTPNIDMTVIEPPTVAAGNTVTVTITNEDTQPMDVYCTIEGNQN